MIGPSLPPDFKNEESEEEDELNCYSASPWSISDTLTKPQISKTKCLKLVAQRTPWMDADEFQQVGQSLFGAIRDLGVDSDRDSTLSALFQAIQRVSSWKVRARNQLPHAVESSYQLALCLYQDACKCLPAESLRLSFAAAILRSINGVSDAQQQQRAHSQSVAALCNDLGIPTWLVDIRHQSTHNQLPSLSIFRLAATT